MYLYLLLKTNHPQNPTEAKEAEQTVYRVRNKQAGVPYIIRKIHPKLKANEFDKIKDEDYFKLKMARICFSCYFNLIKTNDMGGNDMNPYAIKEKITTQKPTGQTLSMNQKMKVSLLLIVHLFLFCVGN